MSTLNNLAFNTFLLSTRFGAAIPTYDNPAFTIQGLPEWHKLTEEQAAKVNLAVDRLRVRTLLEEHGIEIKLMTNQLNRITNQPTNSLSAILSRTNIGTTVIALSMNVLNADIEVIMGVIAHELGHYMTESHHNDLATVIGDKTLQQENINHELVADRYALGLMGNCYIKTLVALAKSNAVYALSKAHKLRLKQAWNY